MFFVCVCQAEQNGFADFHLYVCAAFLVRFNQDILREQDFQVVSCLQSFYDCTFKNCVEDFSRI
jgi:hypothetical protein